MGLRGILTGVSVPSHGRFRPAVTSQINGHEIGLPLDWFAFGCLQRLSLNQSTRDVLGESAIAIVHAGIAARECPSLMNEFI